MFNYEFSKREKILLLCLALLVIGLLWYQLIFVGTSDQAARLDSELAIAQTDLDVAHSKVEKMKTMKEDVAAYKKEGANKVTMPDYDNTTQLMASLNSVLDDTSNYTLSFDAVDDSTRIVERGVKISFDCGSMKAARSIMKKLERETFACSIDSMSMLSNTAKNTGAASSTAPSDTGVSVSLHVVFYETNSK